MNTLSIFFPFATLKKAAAISCGVALLFLLALPSCSTLGGFFSHAPSTAQVTQDTILVVSATREAVLLAGPAAEATLNAYILAVHNAASTLAAGIQTGQSVIPSPAQIQVFLQNIATQYGNPTWMTNLIGNLVTEYSRFYTAISKDSATSYAYLSAFVAGTV